MFIPPTRYSANFSDEDPLFRHKIARSAGKGFLLLLLGGYKSHFQLRTSGRSSP